MNTATQHNFVRRFIGSRPYLILALVVGTVAGLFFTDQTWLRQALIGWNVAVWLYLVIIIPVMVRADYHRVREVAAKQDESAGMVLTTMTLGIALTIAAVISELSGASKASSSEQAIHYIVTTVTIVGSWLLLGVLYCFHYAHKFYNSECKDPELKFPDEEKEPNYWDFAYFSFTLSVAVQTSDVAIMTRGMRKVVLSQAVMCFVFNLVILGLSINIAAGLMNG